MYFNKEDGKFRTEDENSLKRRKFTHKKIENCSQKTKLTQKKIIYTQKMENYTEAGKLLAAPNLENYT